MNITEQIRLVLDQEVKLGAPRKDEYNGVIYRLIDEGYKPQAIFKALLLINADISLQTVYRRYREYTNAKSGAR